MNDIVAKLRAVKPGASSASAGTQRARPVVLDEISVLRRVANEPTKMNGR